MSRTLDGILAAAQRHFGQSIGTPAQLCDLFDEAIADDSELSLQVQRVDSKLRKERKHRKAAEQQLVELSRQNQQQAVSVQSRFSEFENDFAKLRKLAQKQEQEAEQRITEPEAQIHDLKEQLDREKSKRPRLEIQPPSSNPLETEVTSLRNSNSALLTEVTDLQNALDILKHQNAELLSKIHHSEEMQRKLRDRMEESTQKNAQLTADLKKLSKQETFEGQSTAAVARLLSVQKQMLTQLCVVFMRKKSLRGFIDLLIEELRDGGAARMLILLDFVKVVHIVGWIIGSVRGGGNVTDKTRVLGYAVKEIFLGLLRKIPSVIYPSAHAWVSRVKTSRIDS
jgi:chromosome segregation ATPase